MEINAKRVTVLAVALGSLIAAAGCSSSNSSSGGGTSGSTSAASAAGVSSKSISVGMIYEATGALSSTFGQDGLAAAQARIDLQNAEGGVNGRKIVLSSEDDQSGAVGNITAAKLLASKPVFSVINLSLYADGGIPYLFSQGIPSVTFISGANGNPKYTTNFTFNPLGNNTGKPVITTTTGEFFKSIGAKRVALIENNTPTNVTSFKSTIASFTAAGVDVCYATDSIPSTSLDLTTQALAIKKNNCDSMYLPLPVNANEALLTEVKALGIPNFKPVTFGLSDEWISNTASSAAGQGAYFYSTLPVLIPTSENPPVTQAFVTNLQKYDSGYKGGIPTIAQSTGWLSADLMIKGLELAGSNPTRTSFISGLAGLKNYDAGGLIAPDPTVYGFDGPYLCEYFVQLQGKNVVSALPGGKPACGTVLPSS